MNGKKVLLAFSILAIVSFGGWFAFGSGHNNPKNLQASLSGGTHIVPDHMPNEVVVTFSQSYLDSLKATMGTNSLDSQNILETNIQNHIFEKIGTNNLEVKTEILFDTPPSEEQSDRIKRKQRALGLSTTASVQPEKLVFVHIKSADKTTDELLAALADDPALSAAQPNYIYSLPTPNATNQMNIQSASYENSSELWNIFNNANDAGIDADKVWEKGYTGQGVVVAVVDTGVDTDHPDLVNNIWRNEGETNCNDGNDDDNNGYVDDCYGWDFGDYDNDPNPDLSFAGAYHGSHVAGTIAAEHDDSGIVGVAPDAKIMPIKVFPDGGYAQTTTVVNAIQYAWQNNADVISVSIGREDTCSSIESNAIAMAMNAGSLVVTSSGNADPANGLEIPFPNAPAVCDDSVAVGATDVDKIVPTYSNYFNDMVDVVAPGGSTGNMILSANADGGYMGSSGTSMATPHISGIAALLFSKNPLYTPQDVKNLLCQGAEDIEATGKDEESGCGFANANQIFSTTEESVPVISNGSWETNPINGDPSWNSALTFFVCDPDNNLSGGDVRVWNTGTKSSFIGGAQPWGTLPDVSDCNNPVQYNIPVNFQSIPTGEYCVDIEVTDANGSVSNTLNNICITRSAVAENITLSPLLQNVKTGENIQQINATGASSYSYTLTAGNTGITKENCADGASGTCNLSPATGTGTAKLTIFGEETSKTATIYARDASAPLGDFQLSVTADRLYPESGDRVVFTIHYTNTGIKNYSAVRISDTYDTNDINIISVPSGCILDSPLISCEIGALPAGTSGEIDIVATIK